MCKTYLKITLSLVLFCLLTFYANSQDRPLILLDAETSEPVMFAYVVSGSKYLLSDSEGVVWIAEDSVDTLYISHINYVNRFIDYESYKNVDTIFLRRQSFELAGIEVIGRRGEIDLYRLLNTVLRNYQRNSEREFLRFTYLLRTIRDVDVVEQINADISVNYSIGNGARLPQKWLNRGDFEFNHDAPFICLDLEKLIFTLHPFASGRDFNLLSTQRIRKRHHDVALMECPDCEEDQLKLSVSNPSQTNILLIDTSNLVINSATFLINEKADLTFFQLFDESEYDFNEIVISYEFDDLGFPQLIEGNFQLWSDDYSLDIKTLLYPKSDKDDSFRFFVLPEYPFENIYEQIAFQPIEEQSDETKKSFIEENTSLSSLDESIRELIIESPITHYNLIYLNRLIDTVPMRITITQEDYYVDQFNRVRRVEHFSQLKILQSYSIEKKDGRINILSIPPILDLNNTRIYSRIEDPYLNYWIIYLAIYSYEIERQRIMNEFPKEGVDMNAQIRMIGAEFDAASERINELLHDLLLDDYDIDRIVQLNEKMYNELGYNIFEKLIFLDLDCFDCKNELVNELNRLGYKKLHETKKREKYGHYLKLGNIGLKSLIVDFILDDCEERDIRLLGSYYSQKIDYYLINGEFEKACNALNSVKQYWLVGYDSWLEKIPDLRKCGDIGK